MTDFFCRECVAAMPGAKFYLAAGFTLAASAFCLLKARGSFQRARLIEDMPTSRIRSASQGYVELTGLARSGGRPAIAPLSGRPCLWWRYTIERYRRTRKSSSWVRVESGTSTSPFFMDDGSGTCRIDPAGAEIDCLHRKRWYGDSRHPRSAPGKTGAGLALGVLGVGRRYRYTEYLIREDDPVYVLGHFTSDGTGSRTLTVDQVAGRIIRRWKNDFPRLKEQFDQNHDDRLDETEWQAVRQSAQEEAREQLRSEAGKAVEHSVSAPKSGLPYLIGSVGQERLSRRFRMLSVACSAGFLVAGAFATWLLSSRFGG